MDISLKPVSTSLEALFKSVWLYDASYLFVITDNKKNSNRVLFL